MARYSRQLTDAQWEKIRPLLPKRRKRPHGGRPPADDRRVRKAFCGFCAAGLAGVICPKSFLHQQRVGDVCGIGRSEGFGWKSGARF